MAQMVFQGRILHTVLRKSDHIYIFYENMVHSKRRLTADEAVTVTSWKKNTSHVGVIPECVVVKTNVKKLHALIYFLTKGFGRAGICRTERSFPIMTMLMTPNL